ncbi:hypothetical protein BKK79_25920 [Cupriavidus sp. USMAA2-4]|uniref:hypothetical protein n=1 Tax=Cupriavidus sp. USMAA2-4 TaxID=876364 RepID=UPI0008A715ED|nr:hypothetical protein [Cupriavidus sp. USMAA2-4]AOY95228.1 hypothetical protein BKK79_25920 [Cupriavidus sp. USMAA2-4]
MRDDAHPGSDEAARIARRRKLLGIPPRQRDAARNWALALSGGGIRSATFCLGVLQALAKAPPPPVAAQAEPEPGTAPANPATATTAPPLPPNLLAQFDYLSTVSGGGYLGAFFASLFLPGRLRRGSNPVQAAADAYRTLQNEPPGRIHTSHGEEPTRDAVAWLRENGRYLTPTGAGDAFYAAATVVRNWFAMHCVLGSALVVLLAALALGRQLLGGSWLALGNYQMDLLHDARQAFNQGGLPLWWSELMWLPPASLLLLVLPPGLAYWFVYPSQAEPQRARLLNAATVLAALAAAGFLLAAVWFRLQPPAMSLGWSLACLFLFLGAWLLLGLAWCAAMLLQPATVSAYRVRATRALRFGLALTLWLAALGLADTLARTTFLYGYMATQRWGTLLPGGLLAALVWLVRYGSTQLDERSRAGGAAQAGWRGRLPVSLLAGAAAAVLALLVFLLWSWLVLWVRWNGREPFDWLVFGNAWTTPVLALLLAAALGLALLAGRFAGFLNLSTLQPFYAARLTRAYLGASNGQRFGAAEMLAPLRRSALSVAEPVAGDGISLNAYYDPKVLAPLHLINVTLNLTVDPAEQLVQRDRKGKPLCVAPGAGSVPHGSAFLPTDNYVRFTVDGQPYHPASGKALASELTQAQGVGDWVAISGAAISTGLGRATTLGTSLLLGLANLRLGVWWPSYPLDAGHGAHAVRRQADRATHPWLGRLIALFRTQYYLGCELAARFHGTQRGWQYLSDGGHFENTAVYELLRPERTVSLIVLCDCGCDPDYRFGDLANLVRLARIDHGLEIAVDAGAAADPVLGQVFGVPEDFRAAAQPEPGPAGAGKCALLLQVFRAADAQPRQPVCRIVLLKPRLTACAPLDVAEYAATRPAFPQEPTADQFFDEAQWESYRALGLAIGARVFGGGPHGDAVARTLFAL